MIHFQLRGAVIYADVYYRGSRFKISTGMRVKADLWDVAKERAKARRGFSRGQIINRKLEQLARLFEEAATGQQLSAEQLKRDMRQVITPEVNSKRLTALISQYLEEKTELGMKANSTKKYTTLRSRIELFDAGATSDDVCSRWRDQFVSWLYRNEYAINYAASMTRALKTVLLYFARQGAIEIDPDVREKNFAVKEVETDAIYLTVAELEAMERVDLHSTQEQKARDHFLILAFTGLRTSDRRKDYRPDISRSGGRPFITMRNRKTQARVWIPVHPVVERILERHGYALPPISDQKINESIKEVARMAGIDHPTRIVTYPGGKPREQVVRKWQLVTNHTGRRSFATNAYMAGVPSKLIMQILGMSHESTLFRYIRITNEELATAAAHSSFFAG